MASAMLDSSVEIEGDDMGQLVGPPSHVVEPPEDLQACGGKILGLGTSKQEVYVSSILFIIFHCCGDPFKWCAEGGGHAT